MLKYLIQVIQSSLSTGILVAMLVSFSHLQNKNPKKKWVLWGLAAGSALAFILAVLKSTTVLINREYVNIVLLTSALVTELVFYGFLSGTRQKVQTEFQKHALHFLTAFITGVLVLYSLPDIFLYPTEFAAMGTSMISTDVLFKSIGYLAGLAVTGISVFTLYQIGSSLSGSLLTWILSLGIGINMIHQLATILQFLLARRMIPMKKWLFEFIKLSVNYYNFFLYFILLLSLFLPAILWIRSLRNDQSYDNPAQHRKIRSLARRQRRWCSVVCSGYVLALLILTVGKAYNEKEIVLSPAEPMNLSGDEIMIPLETINDGHLHRFVYTASDGTDVRFIVIKKNANAFGVGLDACDICGETGYYERNDQVICKLCDVVMNKQTIGFQGGCNPVPLTYKLNEGNMVIQTQSLENEKHRF